MSESDELKTRALIVALKKKSITAGTLETELIPLFGLIDVGTSTGNILSDAALLCTALQTHQEAILVRVMTGDDGVTRLYINDPWKFNSYVEMCLQFDNIKEKSAVIQL